MSDLPHEHFIRRVIEWAASVPNLPLGAEIAGRNSEKIVAEAWKRLTLLPLSEPFIKRIDGRLPGVVWPRLIIGPQIANGDLDLFRSNAV